MRKELNLFPRSLRWGWPRVPYAFVSDELPRRAAQGGRSSQRASGPAEPEPRPAVLRQPSSQPWPSSRCSLHRLWGAPSLGRAEVCPPPPPPAREDGSSLELCCFPGSRDHGQETTSRSCRSSAAPQTRCSGGFVRRERPVKGNLCEGKDFTPVKTRESPAEVAQGLQVSGRQGLN